MERLDKIIAKHKNISRTDARKFIKNAGVIVDDKIINNAAEKIDTETQCIKLEEEIINFEKYSYIMMNKPAGVISVSNDDKAKTVVDLVPETLRKKDLFPAGRLDKDTVGFILLTNDGNFAHKILSPKNHIEKTYVAKIKYPLKDKDIAAFESGIILGDGTKCMDAKIKQLPHEDDLSVQIKIKEGKYHQIKRMFAALGNEVIFLKRTAMGKLKLDETLSEGECRIILPKELELIQKKD